MVKMRYKIVFILLMSVLLVGCATYMGETKDEMEETVTSTYTDSAIQDSKKTAVLTMCFPNEKIEQVTFSYTDNFISGAENNYTCIYQDQQRYFYPVCYVSGGTVYYDITSHSDYKVFSGTFTIRDISDKNVMLNKGYEPTTECYACGGRMPLDNDNVVICPSCGIEHLPLQIQ